MLARSIAVVELELPVRYPRSGLSQLGRAFFIAFVGIFVLSVITVWLLVALVHPAGLWIFASFWTVIVSLNAYSWLLRWSLELTLSNQDLEWRSVFRRGQTPVSTLRRVRPSRISASRIRVIERSNGRPILVYAPYWDRSFELFCRALQTTNPGLEVRLDPWGQRLRALGRSWRARNRPEHK